MNLINPVSERADRFERLFNTTFALLHKIQGDYDQLRKRNSFYAFVLPVAREHSKLRAKLDFTKKHLVYRKNLLQNNL